ncbi:MAG: protein-tyrosine phosphatase family protein [Gemmataceae bacterium]
MAIMPRPRGGDWLEEEIKSWRLARIDVVVDLLTNEEQIELDLIDEEAVCRANGVEYVSFPITDRGIPTSREAFSELITKIAEQLASSKNVAIHCRQGIGRAALIAICVLVASGIEPATATKQVGAARGCTVPETPEQRRWIADFSESLVAGRSK